MRELRKLRTDNVKRLKLPPYCVLTDRTIDEIASSQPITLESLLQVHGIGQKRQAKYGQQIIGIVQTNKHLQHRAAWTMPPENRISKNRKCGLPTRAYAAWCNDEDEYLMDRCIMGWAVTQIAEELDRQPSAIRARKKKLNI